MQRLLRIMNRIFRKENREERLRLGSGPVVSARSWAPGKKRRKKLRAAMVIGVVFLTACACAVCMRNAQIFQNNVDIQSIGKQINSTTMELNAAKKELASIVDMEAYMQIAKEEYGMDFPAAEQLQQIEVEAMPTEEETLTEIQKSGNLIDSVLDWLNSLGRRK